LQALVFLAVAVLVLSVEARKKSSRNRTRVRGKASKQAPLPLRTAKSRQQEIERNAAVKNVLKSMRRGRIGGATSPSSGVDQPNATPTNQPPPTHQQAVGSDSGAPPQGQQPVAYPQKGILGGVTSKARFLVPVARKCILAQSRHLKNAARKLNLPLIQTPRESSKLSYIFKIHTYYSLLCCCFANEQC
jgi:hypothetical protein